jgi:hypothetical protein
MSLSTLASVPVRADAPALREEAFGMDVIQRHALVRIRGDERNTTVAFAHGGAGQPVFRRSSEDISEPKFCGSRRSSPPANHHVRVRVHAACGSCSTVAVGGRARSRWYLRPSSIVRAVEIVRAHVLVRVVSCSAENPETVDRGPWTVDRVRVPTAVRCEEIGPLQYSYCRTRTRSVVT